MTHAGEHKVVLIVGASSGFGELAAQKLLQKGHTVYAAARRMDRMSKLADNGAKLLEMDVTDNKTVMDGVEHLLSEQKRLDVVMANAGCGSYGAIESVPMDEVRRLYDVNVLGVGRTVKAVLPQMRKQRNGRIIVTASVAGHASGAMHGWYASSKHAVIGVATALRQEVKDMGIQVVTIEPGVVKTEFGDIAISSIDEIDHPKDYCSLSDGFKCLAEYGYSTCPGPERTANVMVKAALARHPKARYKTTFDSFFLQVLKTIAPASLYDSFFLGLMRRASRNGGTIF